MNTSIRFPLDRLCPVLVALVLTGPGAATASEVTPGRKVDGILDNSFLVEEAYNQEPGVVQHIVTAFYQTDRQGGLDAHAWELAFTQEWPLLSQTHQLSYTVPYRFVHGASQSDNGLGDVLLNYRFQACFDETTLRAFAPRFSVILPTGDERRGFGEGTPGCQLNLPFSTALGDTAFLHLNAGTTFQPDAASANGRDLCHCNLGASGIYALTRDCHLLIEWIGEWEESAGVHGTLRREFASVISPGIRKAFNFDSGAQIVAGVAMPIGLTRSAPDYGVFLYLSIEHSFLRGK